MKENRMNENKLSKAETAKLFARAFRGQDGEKMMKYLYSITFERFFGPETGEATLRFAEGQKAIVMHIEALIKTGCSPEI